MHYQMGDVVVVPFPFSDRSAVKRRPALVLSHAAAFQSHHHHSVLAMITTRQHDAWPLDVALEDMESAGLRVPCIVRFKLFTLDHALIVKRIGRLNEHDARNVQHATEQLFAV